MRALSSYPDRPGRCVCSRFFPTGIGFTIFGRLAADVFSVTRPNRVHPFSGLGLASSLSRAFRPLHLGCPDRSVSRASLPPLAGRNLMFNGHFTSSIPFTRLESAIVLA
jgi:hypothetical protein